MARATCCPGGEPQEVRQTQVRERMTSANRTPRVASPTTDNNLVRATQKPSNPVTCEEIDLETRKPKRSRIPLTSHAVAAQSESRNALTA